MGTGFGSRFAGGVRRKPGLDPYTDPTLSELGGQVGSGGEVYNPETLFSRGGRYGSMATFTGGQGEENTYDAQGRKTGVKKFDMAPGNFGYHNPNAGLQQLRGYSSALGNYRGRPGSIGGVNQGAGFGSPDDMIRKLLEARMGGGGF